MTAAMHSLERGSAGLFVLLSSLFFFSVLVWEGICIACRGRLGDDNVLDVGRGGGDVGCVSLHTLI